MVWRSSSSRRGGRRGSDGSYLRGTGAFESAVGCIATVSLGARLARGLLHLADPARSARGMPAARSPASRPGPRSRRPGDRRMCQRVRQLLAAPGHPGVKDRPRCDLGLGGRFIAARAPSVAVDATVSEPNSTFGMSRYRCPLMPPIVHDGQRLPVTRRRRPCRGRRLNCR